MKVTVLIPTRNRPDTLRTALESVFVQDTHIIKRVVVSDNSDNNESKAVVEGFRSSLVHYEKTAAPVLDAIERARQCFGFVDAEYLAILHDDDWWHSGHLSQSVRALNSNPEAALSGSSFLSWKSGQGKLRSEFASVNLILSLCGVGVEQPQLVCRSAAVQAFCLMGGFFHYSTLVLRRSLVNNLDEIFKPEIYLYDTDRLILALAGRHGGAVYNTAPSVTVRFHEAQDSSQRLNEAMDAGRRVSDFIFKAMDEKVTAEVVELIERLAIRCMRDSSSNLAKYICDMNQLLGSHEGLMAMTPQMQSFLKNRRGPWRLWKQRLLRMAGRC